MKLETLHARFLHDGYLHLPGFFDAGLMDQLHELIYAHFGDRPGFDHDDAFISGTKTEVVPWFPQREGVQAFDAIENDPGLASLTRQLLGEAWTSQYCMVMFSSAGTAGQAWHQDCPPEATGRYNLNRLVYTRDIVSENGGQLGVRPGSHRLGELTVGEPHEDLPDQVILSPRKGDLVLLHGHCWHRVLPVVGHWRVSTNFRAAPHGVPDDVTDICVYRNMRYRFSTREVLVRRQPGDSAARP